MSENQNNTVSLYDLINIILSNIRLIILFSLIGVVGSIFYYQNQSNVYKAIIDVRALSVNQFQKLSGINVYLEPKITLEKIQDDFINEFYTYVSLENKILENLKQNENAKSNIELRKQALDLAKEYNLVPSSGKEKFQYPSITYLTSDEDAYKKKSLLEAASEEMYLKVKEDILIQVKNKINEIEKSKKEKIIQLEKELQNVEQRSLDDNERQITYLIEQSEIARTIGLEIGEHDAAGSDYLRGYLALEKEIEILRRRNAENIKEYEYAYDILLNELRAININNDDDLLRNELKILAEEKFKPVNIDFRLVSYEKYLSSINIFVAITVGILFGFFFACLIGILKHIYQNYKDYQQSQD